MIPEQILEKIDRPALKKMLTERLLLYIEANPVDKVILAGENLVTLFLMDVTMPFFDLNPLPEWLRKWWSSGWTGKETSHILPPHKDFRAYAKEIITEIYQENTKSHEAYLKIEEAKKRVFKIWTGQSYDEYMEEMNKHVESILAERKKTSKKS